MVLDYLGIAKNEDWLWQRLKVGEVTPFPKVEILTAELGLSVEFGYWRDDMSLFGLYIEVGLPVIVAVDTDVAEGWPYVDNHAVVVVGFDDSHVYVHDPAQAEMPFIVNGETFLLAWSRRDYEYAVIRLAEAS